MIKQQIYRRSGDEYRVVAASADACDEGWQQSAHRQAALHYRSNLPAAVYYQHPEGQGLLLSRCAVDPNGVRGSYIAHQLIADEPQDVDELLALRPLARSLFREAYVELGEGVERLPTLKAASLGSDDALSESFQVLDRLFDGREDALAGLLHAVCDAVTNRLRLAVVLDGSKGQVSEAARSLMELVARCLAPSLARRLSFCSLLVEPDAAPPYSVSFLTAGAADGPLAQNLTRIDLAGGAMPALPFDARDMELARAMLAHDLNWVERLRSERVPPRLHGASVRMTMPPFEANMSLRQYVLDWMDEMALRREALTPDVFRAFAAREWEKLTEQVVAASMIAEDCRQFLWQLASVLSAVRKGEEAQALCMPESVPADWVLIAADSIRLSDFDLADADDARLLRLLCAYVSKLRNVGPGAGGSPILCRLLGRLLGNCADGFEACVADLSELAESDKRLFADVQALLCRYVDGAVGARGERRTPDDALVRAALLGRVRFEGRVPDFRGANEVASRLKDEWGERARKVFERRASAIRRRMLLAVGKGAMPRVSENMVLLALICALAVLVLALIAFALR